MTNKNLFIVCMNNGGSTMIHECLANCENAVVMPRSKLKPNSATSAEGHVNAGGFMPRPFDHDVGAVWSEKKYIFQNVENYNWPKIKEAWNSKWMLSSKWAESGRVLVEKSPPNVLRARMMEEQFEDPYFIVMVRNPYAIAEGMRRRWGRSVQRSTRHWVESSKEQIENIENLNNVIWFRYEKLCSKPNYIKKKIINFIPELYDLSFDVSVSGTHAIDKHNSVPIKITNFNDRQIRNLSNRDIYAINTELDKAPDVLKYLGYSKM
jgi:hypothetical protein